MRALDRARGAPLAGSAAAVAPASVKPALGRRAPPPVEAGCPVLPASNPINRDISHAPVDPNSAAYIASIGLGGHLHPDFGNNPGYGIPYAVVGPAQPRVPVKFTEYGEESDPGPYPVPPDAPIEGAGRRRRPARAGPADGHLQAV